ncbi:hypothetical protein OAX78_03645, partial [Planctomycetota bacterium]|nr:hypothetical protein [Planctomycetota bacterium]
MKLVMEILSGECDHDLDEAQSAAFEEMLSDPAVIEALAAAENDTAQFVDMMDAPEPSPEAWARVTAGSEEEIAAPSTRRRQRSSRGSRPLMFAIAAAVLLMIGAGFLVPLNL